ncbi:MAG: hypothetical protein N4A31_01185 [Rickettsiales bacterium]|jgi:hypothetical protein|nr:hypothetical protein [Rickettsiales bacterium]
MADLDKEKNIKFKGKGKVLAGMAMMVAAPITSFVGMISMGFGATVGIIGGIGGKAISWCCSDPNNKAYWQQKSKKARSWGTKAFLGGAPFFISPLIAGMAIVGEGLYNQTGKNEYGLMPSLRAVARLTSGGLPQPGDPVLSQEPSLPNQQSNAQHPPLNQFQPVKSISNMSSIVNAPSFKEAQTAYKEELGKTSEDQRYVMGEPQACGNGNYKAVFVPPEYKGKVKECPKELQVEQIFNKDMEVIGIEAGANATCISPPIRKSKSEWGMKKYENGVSISGGPPQLVQNMRGGLVQESSHHPPPPPNVKERRQQHSIR